MQSFSLYWIITSVNDNKTSQFLHQSPTASLGNNQFHFHPAPPPPTTTCEHAAGCQGLNLGFSGSTTREDGERERTEESCPGQQLAGEHQAGAGMLGELQQPAEQQRKSFCDFRQALVWRQPSQIISVQSAQASCLPIGEPLVSRHLKIIIIGQTIITGTTVTWCWCPDLVLCSTTEKDSSGHHSIQAFLSLCLSWAPARFLLPHWLQLGIGISVLQHFLLHVRQNHEFSPKRLIYLPIRNKWLELH